MGKFAKTLFQTAFTIGGYIIGGILSGGVGAAIGAALFSIGGAVLANALFKVSGPERQASETTIQIGESPRRYLFGVSAAPGRLDL